MCGIAGFVGPGDRDDLTAMTDALVHRGPDGEGAYHDPERGVFLGHRRLAIVDLDGGAQPMWDVEHALGVVFNGEIYNAPELRSLLEARGHIFRTDHSDTEVLLHGYREWGEELPIRLNGMFAFCVYDRRRAVLFLARDRFGEKPLYFARQGRGFFFASELSAIAAHRAFEAHLDGPSVQKFFAYGFIPAPRSILQDCRKLAGGSSLRLDLATSEPVLRDWWRFRIEPDEAVAMRPQAELAEELRALILASVQRRLMADVPVGVFLSGGVDSSAVLAAAARFLPRDQLHAFTLGFDEPSFDESEAAWAVAKALGATHWVERLTLSRARSSVMDVLSRLDEPSGDASVLPTALLARFTRKSVKVALSGDGADELFAGYDTFAALGPSRLYASLTPQPLHQLLRQVASRLPISPRNMSLDFKLRRTFQGLSQDMPLWNPVWLAPADPAFVQDIFEAPLNPEALYSEALDLWSAAGSPGLVDRTLEFYTNLYLQDGILNKTDRATMMSSLEARAVFLDNDLVEFCRRLPSRLKLQGGRRKHLLKLALKGMVPDQVLRRRKKGFGIPAAEWLRTLPEVPPLAPIAGVRTARVAQAWSDHRQGSADHRLFLWSWLSLQMIQQPSASNMPVQ